MKQENYDAHPKGAWPRTLTISMDEPLRIEVRRVAAESNMTVSGYLAALITSQNPDGLPAFKRVVTYSVDLK